MNARCVRVSSTIDLTGFATCTDSPPTSTAAPPRSRRWVRGAAVGLFAVSVAVTAYWWPRPKPPAVPVVHHDDDDDIDDPKTDPNPLRRDAGAQMPRQAGGRVPLDRTSRLSRTGAGKMAPGFAPGKGTFVGATRRCGSKTAKGDEFQTKIRKTPAGRSGTTRRSVCIRQQRPGRRAAACGDRLCELPVTWLHLLGRWGSSPFNPLGNVDLSPHHDALPGVPQHLIETSPADNQYSATTCPG